MMLKRSRGIISFILVIVMSFSLLTSAFSASKAESDNGGEIMYTDVSKEHWAYDKIQKCTQEGWFEGYPDGSFSPDALVTRAEAIKIIVSFLGRRANSVTSSSYRDVEVDEWYAPYVSAGEDVLPPAWKITGNVKPDEAITREEIVYMVMTATGYAAEAETANPFLIINAFSDYESISESMQPLFSLARSKDIISGYTDGTVKPHSAITRAELCAILCNAEAAKEKNRLRDEFVKKNGIAETNAIGTENALLLQSTGDYFILDVNAEADGYYTFEMDYSHDSYEIIMKIKTTYPDGDEAECTRGLLSGKHNLSIPVYLKAGKNRVRFQHNLRQVPVYILPLYIYNVECSGRSESLSYEISPDNAVLFMDKPKALLTFIKNYKDELVKIETQDGTEIPFKATVKGDSLYTEAMLNVYPDEAAISALGEGVHELSYHFESGKVLSQKLEIQKTTPEYELEYINFSVGKANSTLIKLPNGKNMLIDSGYDSTAKEKIIPYLEKNNIKLDYYLLTHFHKDHVGMKDEILEMNGIVKPDQEKADELVKADKKERYEYLKSFGYLDSTMVCCYDDLDEIWDLGGVEIEVLNSRFYENGEPTKVYNQPFYRINEYNYENATSVSFMLVYNDFRYYHGADNYSFCQERYMNDMIKSKRERELSCDWYFGNHHFQYDLSPEFIKTLNPVVVYIPNGESVYPRTTYTQHYKEEVESCPYYGKRLEETLVSGEVGSARVCVNSADDWYYETISDEDMYK